MQLAEALPHRVSHVINLDGLPSQAAGARRHQPRPVAAARRPSCRTWLDHRRRAATAQRRAGHARGAGPAPRPPEPPPAGRVAPLHRQHRRPPGRRRVALEARPVDALRRLRPVAARVVAVPHGRARHAAARPPRPGVRGDGLGHPTRGRPAVAAPPGPAGDAGRRRPLRPHRASPTWWPTWSSTSCDDAATSSTLHHNTHHPGPAPPGRRGRRRADPCCCSTASASGRRRRCRTGRPSGRARSTPSTSSATAAPSVPKGGGYSAEVLMADVDVALAELGPSTVVGPRPRRLHRPAHRRRPAAARAGRGAVRRPRPVRRRRGPDVGHRPHRRPRGRPHAGPVGAGRAVAATSGRPTTPRLRPRRHAAVGPGVADRGVRPVAGAVAGGGGGRAGRARHGPRGGDPVLRQPRAAVPPDGAATCSRQPTA